MNQRVAVQDEEMHELREAVRSNRRVDVLSELQDVAVGALFGVASLIAIGRHGEPDKERVANANERNKERIRTFERELDEQV